MRTLLMIAAGAASVIASPVMARDHTGYQHIAAGDLAGAEQAIVAERRIFPGRPELMLNLAAVYAQTGRPAAAAALYRDALAAPEVDLELANGGAASSHLIAETGQARLASVEVEVAGR